MPDDKPAGFGLCDHPDRIAAWVFRVFDAGCPCCTFWRGVALGVTLGIAIAPAAVFVLYRLLRQ